jgi:hypothetical protein
MPRHLIPQHPNFSFNFDFRIGPTEIWSGHYHMMYEICDFADEFVEGLDAEDGE